MKRFIIFVLVIVMGTWLTMKFGGGLFATQSSSGVRIGATVAEVEKVFGPPAAVLPNFGREQRIYKAASGNKYMITFEDGKVVEIH